jgi:PKD repeat protein
MVQVANFPMPDFNGPFTNFSFLAPDGIIYTTSNKEPYNKMSIVAHPNRKGVACDVRKEYIDLPQDYASEATNWSPNYRLGPMDGSPCDTLGFDNYPEARFIWDANPDNAREIRFDDLSLYAPTSWSWDFGDGTATSQDTSPVHVFATTGLYEVCLTVSNENASDTYCETIPVGVTDSETPTQEGVKVWPNPMSDYLQVQLPPRSEAATLVLYDMLGKEVLRQPLATYFINKIGVGQLPSGTYLYEISTADMVVQSGKLMKI